MTTEANIGHTLRMRRFVFLLALAVTGCSNSPKGPDPDVLWKLVSEKCVPAQQAGTNPPAPCAAVDLTGGVAHGSAVLKDRDGATQYLLIPTARITGIEDPAILAPDATNYFARAWTERGRVDDIIGHPLPREAISLAVNSTTARSQNQLHIHIDCLNADVRVLLKQNNGKIGLAWKDFPTPLAGQHYRAMRLAGDDLARINPFKLLAANIPGGTANMGNHTLVVTGTMMPTRKPGFILLDGQADPKTNDPGKGEDLQDHACAGS